MDFAALKVAELRDRLKALGLPVEGIKKDLVERLEAHYASEQMPRQEKRSNSRQRGRSPANQSKDESPSSSPARSASRGRRKASASPSKNSKNGSPSPRKRKAELSPVREDAPVATRARSTSPEKPAKAVSSAPFDKEAPPPANTNNKKKKKKRRRVIEKRELLDSGSATKNVTIEYVPASVDDLGLSEAMPGFEDFSRMFAKFSGVDQEQQDGAMAKTEDEAIAPAADVEMRDAESASAKSAESSDEDDQVMSKRKLRKLRGLTVAQLKQMTDKPEVVEVRFASKSWFLSCFSVI
jgi:hypothetical protein